MEVLFKNILFMYFAGKKVVFDVRNKKDYEILEGLLIFGESLLEIKRLKICAKREFW